MTAPASEPKSSTPPVAPEAPPKHAAVPDDAAQASPKAATAKKPREIGGPTGPEPTRYGDWERNGRVSDF
ncbi:MAG TPA: DUF1674 domain-containing protein [Alphaproteobacteria bacterium]|nr:DUF1674 domain-containing protein [Alphaproteobacteria bacterium]